VIYRAIGWNKANNKFGGGGSGGFIQVNKLL
jgi:hypothetical protein